MARQSKKIAKKIQPKKPAATENKPKPKVGKDYLLIIVISLTVVFLLVGWESFTALNRGLYMALLASLSTTYARRHYNFTDAQDLWLERLGIVTMAVAMVLFAIIVYQQYIA